MAKSLRAALAERNVALSHGECLEIVSEDPASASVITLADVRPEARVDVDVLRKSMLARFERYAQHSGLEAKLSQAGVPLAGLLATFSRMDPGTLADTLAAQTPLQIPQKQQVLELLDVRQRLEYVDALTRELESASSASR
jgi:ATP-dependent Lon protease